MGNCRMAQLLSIIKFINMKTECSLTLHHPLVLQNVVIPNAEAEIYLSFEHSPFNIVFQPCEYQWSYWRRGQIIMKEENVYVAISGTKPLYLASLKWQFSLLPMKMVKLFANSQVSHIHPSKGNLLCA